MDTAGTVPYKAPPCKAKEGKRAPRAEKAPEKEAKEAQKGAPSHPTPGEDRRGTGVWPGSAALNGSEYAVRAYIDGSFKTVELTAGGSDPADAAMLYGQANAALGALWHPLTKAFHVKDGTAWVKLDFDAPGTTLYGQAALSIKIGTLVWIGLGAGWKALFGALAARKRLKRKRRKAA